MNLTKEIEAAVAAKKVNWDRLDTEIRHEGRAITIPGEPAKMPLEKARDAIQRKIEEENQEFSFVEWIDDGHPHDAAVAFVKAMAKLYGLASPQSELIKGMFGQTMRRPPTMISVRVGYGIDEVVQCPMGQFVLPGVAAPINTDFTNNAKGKLTFVVSSNAKKKDRHILLELVTETRRILATESIYRGKAIRFSVDQYGEVDMNTPPEFMDVSDTSEANLIFDTDIQEQINHSILSLIVKRAECKKNKVPFKRGILLSGPYGTGKSLTARMVAAKCEEHGITFILLDRVQGLKAALEFANRPVYAPAVVFAEDIDRIAATRDDDANDLINVIDGVTSKNSEVMTILTTNHVEKLSKVILRPGRLDAIISLRAPSDEAVSRLLRHYAGKLLPESEATPLAARELSGQIPASIKECVERAKLGMIWRGAKTISDNDLTTAAKTMNNHLALLNEDQKKPTHAEKLAESLQAVVNGNKPNAEVGSNSRDTTDNKLNSFGESLNRIDDRTEEILNHLN